MFTTGHKSVPELLHFWRNPEADGIEDAGHKILSPTVESWTVSGVECPDHPRTQLMVLTAGTRLGHCDVTALLGEGGMGQPVR